MALQFSAFLCLGQMEILSDQSFPQSITVRQAVQNPRVQPWRGVTDRYSAEAH